MIPSENAGSPRPSRLSPIPSSVAPPRPALTLVPPAAPRSAVHEPSHRSPLALWHLLSLDAPSVAALWTSAIARAAGLHLSWTAPAAMFLAVWMLYAADRILDARQLDTRIPPNGQTDLEERHRFHHKHRRAFLWAILVASPFLAALLHTLDPRALRLYALLATLLGAWLLLIHARPLPSAGSLRLPKELAVGIFFPAAVFIPTVARLPQLRLALLPSASLFAAVCTLNCLLLYAWEHPGRRSFAHWTTRRATRHLISIAAIIAAASSVFIALQLLHASRLPTAAHFTSILVASCTLLSTLLLLLLHELRHKLIPVHLRALADLVLLTPALLLPLLSLVGR